MPGCIYVYIYIYIYLPIPILFPIFLPFQPQCLLNSIHLSPPLSLNTIFTKISITCSETSWYTLFLLKPKRILRKAEKSYLKHPSPTSLAYYNNLKNLYLKTISTAKASHITHKFDKLTNDSKSIHRLSAQLLDRSLKASPISPLKNYHSSSTNYQLQTPLFPPFPPKSFPTLPLLFPSPLKNLNLPHLIKSSPFSNLPPQPNSLTLFPSQY